MVGASTTTPGESYTALISQLTLIILPVPTKCLFHLGVHCLSSSLSIYTTTAWFQSQKTSSRPIKPMCCSTVATTALPPQAGNKLWVTTAGSQSSYLYLQHSVNLAVVIPYRKRSLKKMYSVKDVCF